MSQQLAPVLTALNNYVADLGLAGLARPQCLSKYLEDMGVLTAAEAAQVAYDVAWSWNNMLHSLQRQLIPPGKR